MQSIVQAVRSCQEVVKAAMLQHSHKGETTKIGEIFSHFGCMNSSSSVQEKRTRKCNCRKGGESTGSWLWCHSNDMVIDAAKNMARNNIGSLVELKPAQAQDFAGIITERENQIRHVPVVDGKLVGSISIKDVVRAVVEQQIGELKRL